MRESTFSTQEEKATKTAISSKDCGAAEDEQTAYYEDAKGKAMCKERSGKIRIAVKEKEHSRED